MQSAIDHEGQKAVPATPPSERDTAVDRDEQMTLKLDRPVTIAAINVSMFLDSLKQQSILEDAQLEEAARDLAPACDVPEKLADQLVSRAWLTRFQAEQLLTRASNKLVIGQYLLLDRLGEGGMGQVFKALHRRLNRIVALKVIRSQCITSDSTAVARFQREAQAAARLNHPNIVTLYDANEVDGVHFLAMEYVAGLDLARVVQEFGRLSLADAVEFLRQGAQGLQHAFEMGMVHRDIKPSNFLVMEPHASKNLEAGAASPPDSHRTNEKGGSSLKGCTIKILDMGLVRLIDPDGAQNTGLTREGVVFGTPDYMAPEQARDARTADIRSDLYSLGCTLYYLLAGRPPFAEGTALEKLLMHQMDQPTSIEKLRPEVPIRVVAILDKLMAKRPEHRYQVPTEVLDDLAGLQVESAAGDPVAAQTFASLVDQPDIPPPPRVADLTAHEGWVMSLAFSADKNRLASGGMDGVVHLWGFSKQVSECQTLVLSRHAEVHGVAFSPDSQLLAAGTGTMDGTIWLWKLAEAGRTQPASLQGHSAPVQSLTFSAGGDLLASGSCDATVRVWDVRNARHPSQVFKGHTDLVKALTFAPDGAMLASGGQDGTLRLWNLGKRWNKQGAVLQAHAGGVLSAQFSPDGKTLATAGRDGRVRLWDVGGIRPDDEVVVNLHGHDAAVCSLQFSHDGRELLSVDTAGHIICWELATRKRIIEWRFGASTLASSHAFTTDGRYLAIGRSNGRILVHRLPFRDLER
jgi:serine/threonine-protein kinase